MRRPPLPDVIPGRRITLDEQIACLSDLMVSRRAILPSKVLAGRVTAEAAALEVATHRAAITTLCGLAGRTAPASAEPPERAP